LKTKTVGDPGSMIGFVFQQFHLVETMTRRQRHFRRCTKEWASCPPVERSVPERVGLAHRGHRPVDCRGERQRRDREGIGDRAGDAAGR
jgi:ABC-type lipoprotein export system ATPase subunit